MPTLRCACSTRIPARRAVAAEIRRALERIGSGQSRPSPQPQPYPQPGPSPEPAPAPPFRPVSQRAPVSASALAGLGEEIAHAGVDKGASILASLDVQAAARVVADCPPKERGALLQGIAAIEAATAATILRMLLADAAGDAFGTLRPRTAASLLAALPTAEAARILGGTDARAAASAITELDPPQAAAQLKVMPDRKRAADVLSHTQSSTAVAIARADRQFAAMLLPYLDEPVRSQVRDAIDACTRRALAHVDYVYPAMDTSRRREFPHGMQFLGGPDIFRQETTLIDRPTTRVGREIASIAAIS